MVVVVFDELVKCGVTATRPTYLWGTTAGLSAEATAPNPPIATSNPAAATKTAMRLRAFAISRSFRISRIFPFGPE